MEYLSAFERLSCKARIADSLADLATNGQRLEEGQVDDLISLLAELNDILDRVSEI